MINPKLSIIVLIIFIFCIILQNQMSSKLYRLTKQSESYKQQISTVKEDIKTLKADWTVLNNPQRLEQLFNILKADTVLNDPQGNENRSQRDVLQG